jgi:hypothetical protein
MSSHTLYRWAAVALVVSGISLAIGLLLHPTPPYGSHVATTHWAVAHLFWWIGGLAGMAGISGLFLRQRADVGILGFIGSGLAVIGLALISSAMFFEAFIAPSVAARAPELFEGFPAGRGWEGFLAGVLASGMLYGMGFLLFAIAMLRAHTMPRWAIVLAVLGGIPFAVNFLIPRPLAFLAVVVQGFGLVGLGWALWKNPVLAPNASRAVA